MATIKCKGLTGVTFDLTIADMGVTTMNGLTALAQSVEGHNITTAMYGEISAAKNPSINQTNDGAKTLTAAGLVDGDIVICTPADDPTSLTKEERADQKLYIAEAKRKGLAAEDTTANYYRTANTYNKTMLPNPYEGDAYNADDDENTGALVPKRPWDVSEIAAPASIEEAVGGDAIVNLQVWYDAADTTQYVPSATDETGITQLKDKSAFAHNANPLGGSSVRPSYEDTDTSLTNGYGYIEFDGVNDNLYINPFTQISEQDTYTIFFAAKLNDASDGQALGGVNRGGLSIRTAGGVFTTVTAGLTGTTAVSADTDWHVFAMRIDLGQATDAARSLLRIDGHNKATGANDISSYSGTADATTGTNDGYFLGCRGAGGSDSAGPTAYAAMYMGEVLMFNYALTDIEVKNIENYLSNKWGL